MIELTQDLLKELFTYIDGNLYWKVANSNCVKIGDRAGWGKPDGYRSVGIGVKQYRVHRLVFLYHHGYLPKYLDHIDGDPSNNDISNLREATNQENGMNQKKTKSYGGKSTSSKYKGVYWHKRDKKWMVNIQIDGKREHFGPFTSEISAAKAYNKAAVETSSKFTRLNVI